MNESNGGPAFPVPYSNEADGPTMMPTTGMSVRQYFAAKVMQGFCANPAIFAANPQTGWDLVNAEEDDLVAYAFKWADRMIANELNPSAAAAITPSLPGDARQSLGPNGRQA